MPEISSSSPRRDEKSLTASTQAMDASRRALDRAMAPNRERVQMSVMSGQDPVSMKLPSVPLYKKINCVGDLRRPMAGVIVPGKEAASHGETLRGGPGVPSAVAKDSLDKLPEYLRAPAAKPEGPLSLDERAIVARQEMLAGIDPRMANAEQAKGMGSCYVLNRVLEPKLYGGREEGQQVLGELRGRFVDLQQREGSYPPLERLEAQGLAAPGAGRVLPKERHRDYIQGIQDTLGLNKEKGVLTAAQVLKEDRLSSALERIRIHGGPEAVLGKAPVELPTPKNADRLERLGGQLEEVTKGVPLDKRVAAAGQVLDAMAGARNRILQGHPLSGSSAQAAVAEQAVKLRLGEAPPKGGFSLPTMQILQDRVERARMPEIQKAVQGDFQKLGGYLQQREQALAHSGQGRNSEAHAALEGCLEQWEQARGVVRPESMAALRAQGFGPGQVKEQVKGVQPDVQQEAWGRARLERITDQLPAGVQNTTTFLYRPPGRQTEEFFPMAAYQQNGTNHLAFEHNGLVVTGAEESMRQNPRHPGHGVANALSSAARQTRETQGQSPWLSMSKAGFVEIPSIPRSADAFHGAVS